MLFLRLVWQYFTDLEPSSNVNLDTPMETEYLVERESFNDNPWGEDYFYNPTRFPGDGQFPTAANGFNP